MQGGGWRDKPVRVMIVADDALTRMGLAALLEAFATVEVVGQTSDIGTLEMAVDAFRPDVVLWDTTSAGTEEPLPAFSSEPPWVLALQGRNENRGALWESAVRGVIGRDAGGAQIEAALLAVARGLIVSQPGDVSLAGDLPGNAAANARLHQATVETLTQREMEVLQLLAEGMANKEIARHLSLSENTVKFHVNSILGKLGAASRTDAVVRATRAGLLLL